MSESKLTRTSRLLYALIACATDIAPVPDDASVISVALTCTPGMAVMARQSHGAAAGRPAPSTRRTSAGALAAVISGAAATGCSANTDAAVPSFAGASADSTFTLDVEAVSRMLSAPFDCRETRRVDGDTAATFVSSRVDTAIAEAVEPVVNARFDDVDGPTDGPFVSTARVAVTSRTARTVART
jgi:hypothetical protein